MNVETCDALIVGGGPAGSSCARQLRRQGLDVVVMDKVAFPRDKVCAGWITPEVVAALQLDVSDYAGKHVFQPITAFRTGLIGGRELETRYPDIVSYGIRRSEFDDYLLQRSGARLRLGEGLASMERHGQHWIVNDAWSTPLIIGAGGHFCPVARVLGARLGAAESAVTAKEIEFQMTPRQIDDCQVRPDTPELYFSRDLKGYGWCFRKGRHLNVGFGREGHNGLNGQLKDFLDFIRQRGRIPRDTPEDFRGHAYLTYGRERRKPLDDGVLLVGDAAGLAYAQSGEGIRPAVESGLMAAASILEAGENYRREKLAIYPARLPGRFGKPAPPSKAFPEFLRPLLAGKLMANRWFTRSVVLDRWFLHAHQAELQIV